MLSSGELGRVITVYSVNGTSCCACPTRTKLPQHDNNSHTTVAYFPGEPNVAERTNAAEYRRRDTHMLSLAVLLQILGNITETLVLRDIHIAQG